MMHHHYDYQPTAVAAGLHHLQHTFHVTQRMENTK